MINPTAIVIDDDRDNVDLFCEYLELINIKILGQGYDGKDAVELYAQYKPDIVFLDLLMPNYDGFYALENIRALDPNAYVVVITAVVDKEDKVKFEKTKPNHIIHKPFDQEQIIEVISKLERRQQAKPA